MLDDLEASHRNAVRVKNAADAFRSALKFLIAYYDNETPDSVELEHVIDQARMALKRYPE